MQESLRDYKKPGRFESSEEYRRVSELKKMQEGLRAQKDAGRFERSEECRKV